MPIINQPQVGIVSTDAIVRKPVVANLADGGEAIVVHPVGNLAMSWDHRAFDGAYAAGFLRRVKEILKHAIGWQNSERHTAPTPGEVARACSLFRGARTSTRLPPWK